MKEKRVHVEESQQLLSFLRRELQSDSRIALFLMKEVRFVRPIDIIRCEAANNYSRFYLSDGEVVFVSKGLYEFEEFLNPFGFIRVHQSHIVNRYYIRSLHREDNVHEIQLMNKTMIPVSRLQVEKLRKAMMGV